MSVHKRKSHVKRVSEKTDKPTSRLARQAFRSLVGVVRTTNPGRGTFRPQTSMPSSL